MKLLHITPHRLLLGTYLSLTLFALIGLNKFTPHSNEMLFYGLLLLSFIIASISIKILPFAKYSFVTLIGLILVQDLINLPLFIKQLVFLLPFVLLLSFSQKETRPRVKEYLLLIIVVSAAIFLNFKSFPNISFNFEVNIPLLIFLCAVIVPLLEGAPLIKRRFWSLLLAGLLFFVSQQLTDNFLLSASAIILAISGLATGPYKLFRYQLTAIVSLLFILSAIVLQIK